jgi:hypothetical protein
MYTEVIVRRCAVSDVPLHVDAGQIADSAYLGLALGDQLLRGITNGRR